MAEKAPVLGWVVFRQRGFPIKSMALITEFLRRLFIHLHEFDMVLIVWQELGCFFGRPPEKQKKSAADNYKNQIVNECVFSFGFLFFGVHWLVLDQSDISSMLKGISPVRNARMSVSIKVMLTSLFLAENSTMR